MKGARESEPTPRACGYAFACLLSSVLGSFAQQSTRWEGEAPSLSYPR